MELSEYKQLYELNHWTDSYKSDMISEITNNKNIQIYCHSYDNGLEIHSQDIENLFKMNYKSVLYTILNSAIDNINCKKLFQDCHISINVDNDRKIISSIDIETNSTDNYALIRLQKLFDIFIVEVFSLMIKDTSFILSEYQFMKSIEQTKTIDETSYILAFFSSTDKEYKRYKQELEEYKHQLELGYLKW